MMNESWGDAKSWEEWESQWMQFVEENKSKQGETMNWLQIKDAWRDINLYNQRYRLHLKANADSGTVTISASSKYASSIVLSREDLVELGRFLKPFVDEAENDGS